jgi:hypothetical protein
MTFGVTYTFTGQSSLNPAHLDQNFSDTASKINGGITDENIASGANINTAKLANRDFGFVASLKASSPQWAAAVAGGELLDLVPIPHNLTDTWTLVGWAWSCTDTGNGAGIFRVEKGHFVAGVWTADATLINATTITNGAGANDSNAAISNTFNVSSFTTTAGSANFIALLCDTPQISVLSAQPSFLKVDIFIKRASGLGTF